MKDELDYIIKEFSIQNLITPDNGNKNNMEMFEKLQKILNNLMTENEREKEKEKIQEKQTLKETLSSEVKIHQEMLTLIVDCKNK